MVDSNACTYSCVGFATFVDNESRHGSDSLTFGDVRVGIDITLEELGLFVFYSIVVYSQRAGNGVSRHNVSVLTP